LLVGQGTIVVGAVHIYSSAGVGFLAYWLVTGAQPHQKKH